MWNENQEEAWNNCKRKLLKQGFQRVEVREKGRGNCCLPLEGIVLYVVLVLLGLVIILQDAFWQKYLRFHVNGDGEKSLGYIYSNENFPAMLGHFSFKILLQIFETYIFKIKNLLEIHTVFSNKIFIQLWYIKLIIVKWYNIFYFFNPISV